MFNLGTVHMRAGDVAEAEAWFRAAIQLDPELVDAHQNLAALLQEAGRLAEASHHRDRAFRNAALRIEAAPKANHRVLVLSAAGTGNVPIETLLPRGSITRLKFFVEYATEKDWATLPPYDVVFNAIGDADLLPSGPWQEQLDRLGGRVLNAPSLVARTRRDRLPELLCGVPDVVVPGIVRHCGGESSLSLNFPVLVRPLGAHGGAGVTLATSMEGVPSAEAYLTEYHDYRSSDGYFRKYRVIYVGGVPYPYHLAVSAHWLVHYFSADMQEAAWKRAEEGQFLSCPSAILGPRAMTALAAIGRRLELDYAGIDFSILPDGRLLVFEANATMAVHLNDCPVLFDYKHRAVPRILNAFQQLLKDHARAALQHPSKKARSRTSLA
jgi:tetratricopeptide (TPR) repeat protein